MDFVIQRSFERLSKAAFEFSRNIKRLKYDIENTKSRWVNRKHRCSEHVCPPRKYGVYTLGLDRHEHQPGCSLRQD